MMNVAEMNVECVVERKILILLVERFCLQQPTRLSLQEKRTSNLAVLFYSRYTRAIFKNLGIPLVSDAVYIFYKIS